MTGYIYRITNNITSDFYIGKTKFTIDRRFLRHKNASGRGSGCYLHRAMRKYGVGGFSVSVVEEVDMENINNRERYWIAQLSPLYNMTAGGDGGGSVVPSKETRAKISTTLTGKKRKPFSEEHKRKLREVLIRHRPTKPPSIETRQKMSEARIGKKVSEETRLKMCAAQRGLSVGRVYSKEARQNMSEAHKGKKFSFEHKRRIQEAKKGQKRKYRNDGTYYYTLV